MASKLMRYTCVILFLCEIGSTFFARADASADVLYPKFSPNLRDWREIPAANNDMMKQQFKFRVSMKQRNIEQLKTIALERSNPTHAKYGQYLKQSEIDKLTLPTSNNINIVQTFIEKKSLHKCVVTNIVKEMLEVSCENSYVVQDLFKTKFYVLQNRENLAQQILQAKDFYVPKYIDVLVQSIYGLHGLPLPPRAKKREEQQDPPAQPASVTPSVIEQVYNIKDAKVSGSSKNRQAVAEFQGQTMEDADLTEFFKNYVPKAAAGDDKVYKFVGDPGEGSPGVEASLDIQYIMGVAPGVKTEFWYFASNDFCGDLKNWTGMLLANDDVPLVTSVSYGWQGDLSQIGCKAEDVTDVDNDFVKLAAKGITIIFASGDSGSGYAPQQTRCTPTTGEKDTAYEGDISETQHGMQDTFQCCFAAGSAPWTFSQGAMPSSKYCDPGIYEENKVITGTKVFQNIFESVSSCCSFAKDIQRELQKVAGWTFEPKSKTEGTCTLYSSITGSTTRSGATSLAKQPPTLNTTCNIFKTVTSTKKVQGSTSYTPGSKPKTSPLYPSWPASSPWVTAVGSTRFVDQKVGNEEMATDQFGSGGGFSSMFGAFKDQENDVLNYFKIAPQLPPANMFNKTGRATPDVAALGEGFQVITGGRTQAVGGTSASAPTFAAVVSLLNEARLNGGKSALGYLNPWLYANPTMLTDIVKGNNAIGRGTYTLPYGFNCTKGYDPVSGLGTPDYEKMLQSAMNL